MSEVRAIAEAMHRVLREVAVKDEFRPACAGAMVVARWHGLGDGDALQAINAACDAAFARAGRLDLAALQVPEDNHRLAERAPELLDLLGDLGGEGPDRLGELYEACFRYTGGNSIGQYFTPRHLTEWMADLVDVQAGERVLDPAAGSGGFLVAALRKGARIAGWEPEPVAMALCAANALLRGADITDLHRADVLTDKAFPEGAFDAVLMNPPFPHRRTDTPPTVFVDRALTALKPGGRLAAVLPSSVLSKREWASWREAHAAELAAVVRLPDELFQPWASVTTSVLVLEKERRPAESVFVRVRRDGLALKKGVRVPKGETELPRAADVVLHRREMPGFSGRVEADAADWSPGAYIPSAPASSADLRADVDDLLRRMASFYVRYAESIAVQRARIEAGELPVVDYRQAVTDARLRNADALPREPGTVGERFLLLYGMKELHSRDGIPPGDTLIISPTEAYNGCYGWMEFEPLLRPPFVTVAQTGSIGEAFVQLEPCAVNDDCLVLLPRGLGTLAELVLAAAAIRQEQWRFSYGRKLTPSRIAGFALPSDPALTGWVAEQLAGWRQLCEAAVARYR